LKEVCEKQKKVMRDLDRQYEIARETTHMGRGLGLGFHQ
uniref:SMAP domain-containing protein n=1 Tax=Heligmosomoides polygyrus TaxID=6339 RepID=A0A183FZ40_HELPZ